MRASSLGSSAGAGAGSGSLGLAHEPVDSEERETGGESVGGGGVPGDREHGTGVGDHVAHLRRPGGRVERDEHGTGAQHSRQRGDRTERGACAPEDPVARPDAVPREHGGQPRRVGLEAGAVRDAAAPEPVEEHGGVGAGRPLRLPHLGQRPARAREVVRAASAPGARAPSPPATAGHSLAFMTARRIAIVPHTHWDREWYKSYQDFRLALVELIDTLIPLLERDASYPHFMLDGQMAVVDDYLEVRPEAEERLRALAAAGRLSMGPWYILMDEFLASGETIVRNLQMGIERGAAFGGTMDVGYLPDMFGHIAQMPQILRLAGFGDAVVWRGVPSLVHRNAFVWEAPDGSAVRAEYLPVGYGNGAALPDDAKALVRRTADHVAELGDLLVGDLLCMNGSDHLMPQPWLGRVVAEANDLQDDYHFEVTSLSTYLSAGTTEGLTVVEGELRSGYRANMLMGVTSNRVDVKRRGALAERELERRAEPLAALFQSPEAYPSRLLDLAWKEMVRNSAHDSICACSVDDVVDAVLHRYAEARAIAAGLADRSVKAFALSLSDPGVSVLNASPHARSGVVELVVPADGPAPAQVQVLSERSGLPGSMVLDANTVRTVLGMLQGPRIDDDAWVHDIRIEDTDEGIDVTLAVGTEEKQNVPIAEAKQDLYTRLGRGPTSWCVLPWSSRRRGGSSPAPARWPGTGGAPLRPRRWRTQSRCRRPAAQ